ncbi:hypothetical protein Dimus_035297 [Dionaea muscipula]
MTSLTLLLRGGGSALGFVLFEDGYQRRERGCLFIKEMIIVDGAPWVGGGGWWPMMIVVGGAPVGRWWMQVDGGAMIVGGGAPWVGGGWVGDDRRRWRSLLSVFSAAYIVDRTGMLLLGQVHESKGKECPQFCQRVEYMTCPSSGHKKLEGHCNCCLTNASKGCTLHIADADGSLVHCK